MGAGRGALVAGRLVAGRLVLGRLILGRLILGRLILGRLDRAARLLRDFVPGFDDAKYHLTFLRSAEAERIIRSTAEVFGLRFRPS